MRTQVNKRGLFAFCLMLASIALVVFMMQLQVDPAKGVDQTPVAEKKAVNRVLPVSPEDLFSQAEKYEGVEDHLNALKMLAKIDETWPQYPQAAALIRECEEELLAEVSSPSTIEDYMECERKVNEYLEIRNSTAFLERKQELVRDRDDFFAAASVIEEATGEVERGDYPAAFETLSRDERGRTENRFLADKLEELHAAYVEDVSLEAKRELENQDYAGAVRIVNEALEVYDCEELHRLRRQIMEEADPLYGVYNDFRDTVSDWYDYWTEGSEETEQPFGLRW